MPTENRSSNTEIVSVPAVHGLADKVREALDRQACPNAWMIIAYEAVVANFPQSAPQPHPEPIAWMVGTAFWWTKEEAERDAAATGLPTIPVGPINDSGSVIREAEQAIEAAWAETAAVRAQLAERDALLDRVVDHAKFWHDHPYAEVVEGIARDYKSLSASAEPSALPDPLGCNECTHAECGKFDGPRQIECRAMADNACARHGASS